MESTPAGEEGHSNREADNRNTVPANSSVRVLRAPLTCDDPCLHGDLYPREPG